jgi:hypothetical protein
MNTTTRQDYFTIGCKLLGIYSIIEAIPAVFHAINMLSSFGNYPDDLSKSMAVAKIIAVITPIVYGAAGVFLVTSGKNIYEVVYKNASTSDELVEIFQLFMKMLGLFFLITYTSKFLSIFSDFLFQYLAPEYMDMFTQTQNVYTNFLPSLFGMAIGAYLLMSGKIFVTLGFKNKNRT